MLKLKAGFFSNTKLFGYVSHKFTKLLWYPYLKSKKKKHKPDFIREKILSVGVVDNSQSTILCCLIIDN